MFLPARHHTPPGHSLTMRLWERRPLGLGPLCASCAELLHLGCRVRADRWPALLVCLQGGAAPQGLMDILARRGKGGQGRAGPRREGPRLGGRRRAWRAGPVSQECWTAGGSLASSRFQAGSQPLCQACPDRPLFFLQSPPGSSRPGSLTFQGVGHALLWISLTL